MLRLFSMRVCEFTIIHTRVGGYGFLSRCARAIFVLGFWCFGEQVFAPIFSLRVLRFWSNIYACWRLRVLNPLCTCRYYFSWLLVLWGASNCERKKASCMRPHWRRLRVWKCAAGFFFPPNFFFSLRVLRFWFNIYECWRLQIHIPMCTCEFFSWLLVQGKAALQSAGSGTSKGF